MKSIVETAADLVSEVRRKSPLVHHITNYVTVNDCANVTLAIGASPIMADESGEVEDIVGISSSLVLNIGTLNRRTIASAVAAGKKANEVGIPVVLDPVGAGASRLRNDTTKEILKQVRVSILRGNLSEISFIAGLEVSTKGVDASESDANNDAAAVAKAVAKRYHCVAAVTGAVDAISDGERVVKIENGHPTLSKVTGTGCMTTSLTGSFAGACGDMFTAAVAGVAAMGIAGEIAYEKAGALGTGSFRVALVDAVSKMDESVMKSKAKFYEA